MRLLFWKKPKQTSVQTYKRIKPKRDYFRQINQLGLDPVETQQVLTIWLEYFLYVDHKAKQGKRSGYAAQIITIVFGAIIPFLTQLSSGPEWDYGIKITVAAMSVTMAVVTALVKLFNLDIRGQHYRFHAETIRREGENFFALVGRYRRYDDHKAALKPFCSYVSNYRLQELNQYVDKIDANQNRDDDDDQTPAAQNKDDQAPQ